ncbi:MAG: Na/Pi cotransporter family protein [Bernardetiaceae bacterium]|nr:Na/Pi cotransporter family protein [Bernardetiaceae bacterium]
MSLFNTAITAVAAITLFLFSLRGFSKELQELGADKLNVWLTKITKNRLQGFLLGALITAIIQSSSAVSSITVALVDSGVISFYNSLSILIGANLGTTFTAWLVAFKLDNLGSILLILGTVVSIIPFRVQLVGKSIFYLGLILFSLQQISIALKPLSDNPEFVSWLGRADHIAIGIIAGTVITAVVQSSSVTTGLTIILSSQGLLGLTGAIAIVVGSNLGTTSTALLASLSLSRNAKRAAVANLIFNVLGLLVFIPVTPFFIRLIEQIDTSLDYQVAIGHLIFNLVVSFFALALLTPVARFLTKEKTNSENSAK